ncbi:zinc ribbon domain-containing protein [Halovivax cerinus]|uniref:Zinc-ribbon domain-containing protein n=1 Tax=Halovivax cerinus TaxID=1487865 RepID=A0ABD5NLA8_9EURY|nr:zinc ribbon domain-containing protein [Halovivax cerinus]
MGDALLEPDEIEEKIAENPDPYIDLFLESGDRYIRVLLLTVMKNCCSEPQWERTVSKIERRIEEKQAVTSTVEDDGDASAGYCPQCGTSVDRDDRFCRQCGEALEAGEADG